MLFFYFFINLFLNVYELKKKKNFLGQIFPFYCLIYKDPKTENLNQYYFHFLPIFLFFLRKYHHYPRNSFGAFKLQNSEII